MIEHSNELIEELIETFRNFKKIKFKKVSTCGDFTHNEKMILFILKDISKDSKVSLSAIRERIKLAPSTITPIIALLEKKGLIQRNIDKTDRRNIFLQISPKGEKFTEKIQIEIKNEMSKYIEYIGEEDTKQLIRLISKTTDFFERKGRGKRMKKVLKHLKQYNILIVIAMTLIFLQSIANLYLPTLMSEIVNEGVIGQNMDSVWKYGGKMLLVTLGAMICSIISTFIASRVAAGFGKNLRKAVFTKVEDFSLNEFNKIQTSSLITRTTNDVSQIQNLTLMMIRMMILAPMMCIGGIIMATAKNLELSLLFVVVIPILLAAIILLARKIVPLFTEIQKRTDKINQVVREKLTGVRVIRAFGTEEYEGKRYDKANKDIYETSIKAAYIMSSLMPIIIFIINISTIAIVWFGSQLIGDGALQIGDMMAFMQYAMQVLFSILMVTMLFIMIPRAIVSAKRINEVLEIESSIKDSEMDIEKGMKFGEIEFKNVTFAYNESNEPVLNNLNFKINKGETVAIIGGTGSGKSTLLNLILRFYDVTSGEITVAGVPVKEIGLKSLRNMIGYVPQKVNLFSGSIADNIRYGKQGATDEEIREAARIAQSLDFISSLDKGFESMVSQGGTNYSGGQKQRISIARAIVKNPDIYVFDDSFSALDYTTDKKLREALIENIKGATLVIVAQRVSTIMNADNIIFLDEGKIIAQGKHHELLENCQAYKEVVMSQITEEEAMSSGK